MGSKLLNQLKDQTREKIVLYMIFVGYNDCYRNYLDITDSKIRLWVIDDDAPTGLDLICLAVHQILIYIFVN